MSPESPPGTGEARFPGALNLMRYELATIRLAVECAREGQLSRAASNIHMSVSGASHRLKTLEGSLGKRLFVRLSNGMAPTPAGEVFVVHGRRVLESLDRMREAVGAADPAG
ncbi:MAG: LysR family transcriptional regulator [Ramlibacter sp.]|nr:LysR family transcriptional regulator [Ramlibacter sp.]